MYRAARVKAIKVSKRVLSELELGRMTKYQPGGVCYILICAPECEGLVFSTHMRQWLSA